MIWAEATLACRAWVGLAAGAGGGAGRGGEELLLLLGARLCLELQPVVGEGGGLGGLLQLRGGARHRAGRRGHRAVAGGGGRHHGGGAGAGHQRRPGHGAGGGEGGGVEHLHLLHLTTGPQDAAQLRRHHLRLRHLGVHQLLPGRGLHQLRHHLQLGRGGGGQLDRELQLLGPAPRHRHLDRHELLQLGRGGGGGGGGHLHQRLLPRGERH